MGAGLEHAVYCGVTARGSDRPTVPPAFDVERYARDSEARLRGVRPAPAARTLPPPLELDLEDWAGATPQARSEVRLVSRADIGAEAGDEGWAQAMVGKPYVAMPGAELTRLHLDPRAAFVLSRIDGAIDLETLIAVSAMPRDEALRVTRDLVQAGIVAFR
jgi:hypothetical protein